MSATLTNGTRKSLSDQLDRFDAMLDGLSDAIPEVIADSVRAAVSQAVSEAVQTALTAILSHPEVLDRLAALRLPSPAQPPQPGPLVSRLRRWIVIRWVGATRFSVEMARRCSGVWTWMHEKFTQVRRWGKSILAGLAVSSAVTGLAQILGPWTGSLVCAASVFTLCLLLSVQIARTSTPATN